MKKKILIADGDPVSIIYYKKVFAEYHLFATTNGEDALKIFIEHQPDFVIINSRLRNVNGFNVVREIRAINEVVRISMVATYYHDQEQALIVGCNDFHTKPISPDNLRKIVE